MKKRYFLGIAIIILIIVSARFLWNDINHKQATQTTKKTPKVLPKEATVTLDKNGFSPKTVMITVGGAVRWKNESGKDQTVNSDNYPTNQLHRELNFGVFSDGSSVVYTFTKPGTYGYHNQFHPEQKGKIVVEK